MKIASVIKRTDHLALREDITVYTYIKGYNKGWGPIILCSSRAGQD